ncbi:MAG: hypothetical protein G01um101472_23 [Parcubacteria group bacterium Gr01-1014_72]|nr:MAG: hypothetical protein G01um101472_23 [Parcubacteria group bacterium Gr01-1014_72]
MKTNIIGLKELRENTETYIRAVGRGKSFVVVRRSKPAFKITPVDEWGDEGTWETLLDLTKGREKLITAEQLLSAIHRFNAGQNTKIPSKA